MSANLGTEQSAARQNAANPGSLTKSLLLRFLPTFQGWLARFALRHITTFATSVSTAIGAKWVLLEQMASKQGFNAENLAAIHDKGIEFKLFVGGIIIAAGTAIVDTIVSRIAAKVAEQPIIPVAPPVTEEEARMEPPEPGFTLDQTQDPEQDVPPPPRRGKWTE